MLVIVAPGENGNTTDMYWVASKQDVELYALGVSTWYPHLGYKDPERAQEHRDTTNHTARDTDVCCCPATQSGWFERRGRLIVRVCLQCGGDS